MGAGASLQEAPSPGWHALAEMAEAADKPDVVAKLVREHQIDAATALELDDEDLRELVTKNLDFKKLRAAREQLRATLAAGDRARLVPSLASSENPAAEEITTVELDERWVAVERDFERVVPQKDGRYAPEDGYLQEIKEVISRASPIVNQYYHDAWTKCQENGDVDGFLTMSAALAANFTPVEPPRCALPEDSSVDALIDLASRHGGAMLESLAHVVQATGGEYERGPRKKPHRILQKAQDDYGNDLARVVDVERATGIFDSADDLSEAILVLRGNVRRKRILVRRCKDHFGDPIPPGYRDLQLNVERDGFVCEIQMNLRQIVAVKGKVHKIYEVARWMDGAKALAHAVDRPGLESEPVLRLITTEGDAVVSAFGSIGELETALARALPPGCAIANVDIGEHDDVLVSLSIDHVVAAAKLRDVILLDSGFEEMLNEQVPSKSVRVDRGAFVKNHAMLMMRFTKLTQHQLDVLEEVRVAMVAVILSPAGGGKTFLAIQRVLEELRSDTSAVVLFVARNTALALFVCKWLVVASRKSAEHVVHRVHVLVAPFAPTEHGPRRRLWHGPRRVRVEGRRLVLDAVGETVVKYALVVVDEAHHLVGDTELHGQLEAINTGASKLLFLGDASQATSAISAPHIAHSLVDLPPEQDVIVATLSEVVRSTKRIVAGAAAFQLEAGRKAATSTHGASVGPPLVARIFSLVKGDDAVECYAREVVEAISAVRTQLADLSDLDDHVVVVGPDDLFVERLRGPLERALDGGFELVDAATASAVLPRAEIEARAADAKQLLVVDSVDNMDGLKRLVVICVGLDHVIDRSEGVLETRSRLYRAMTRAQLAVAVVNEVLPGGWLEFLGRVELSADAFDDAAERENRAETATDDVVGAVVHDDAIDVSGLPDDSIEVIDTPARASDAVDAPAAENKGATDAVDADAATSPSAPEPMNKILQSIWDASAVATASRGDLRFMPFSNELDPSKLAELRTLQGHSGSVMGVAVFPDGRRVVSGSWDKTLKFWGVS